MILFFILISKILAHSWIHCLDYPKEASLQKIDDTLCRAWPRGMQSDIFGMDRGMNYQPEQNKACRNPMKEIYKARPGQNIRILWPAKNHQADVCTNPYIPKGTLGIYSVPVKDWKEPDLSFTLWYTSPYLLQELQFQNCPYFCENTDKAACYGDVTLPNQPGKYKMNWIWMFNPGQYYTHCFDIEIIDSISYSSPTRSKPISSLSPTRSKTLPPSLFIPKKNWNCVCHFG
jgi:hypothetical protein